jgi:hypothetical protein
VSPRKSGKITVRRAEREAVLNSQRGEVRIRHEIAVHSRSGEQVAQHCVMLLSRRGRLGSSRGVQAARERADLASMGRLVWVEAGEARR